MVLLMKKLLHIIVLGLLLGGCATNIEPTSQKNNPAKVNDKIKIIYADPDEIIIMYNQNPLSLRLYAGFKRPPESFYSTAFNHCSIYKKNLYFLYQNNNNLITFDWRKYKYQNKIYSGYRFLCDSSSQNALLRKHTPKIIPYNNYDRYLFNKYARVYERERILSEEEIASKKRKKIEEEKRLEELRKLARQKLAIEYEPKYKNLCLDQNFVQGTESYIDCLIQEEYNAVQKKIEEDNLKRKKKIELEKKLAALSPTERHAYNCSETFNFKKGTEQFNNCVFELYKAELDIQRLELEKDLAEAKAKAASSEQVRAEAVAKAQVAAANANRRAANLNSSMQLMKLSNALINGTQQKSNLNTNNFRLKTTCNNVGGFLTCF